MCLDGRQVACCDRALRNVVTCHEWNSRSGLGVDDRQLGARQRRVRRVGSVAGDRHDETIDRVAQRVDQSLREVTVVDNGHHRWGTGKVCGGEVGVVQAQWRRRRDQSGQRGLQEPLDGLLVEQADRHAGRLLFRWREDAAVDESGFLGDSKRAAELGAVVLGDVDTRGRVFGDDNGLVGVEDNRGEKAERLDRALVRHDHSAGVSVVLQRRVDGGCDIVELRDVKCRRGVEQGLPFDTRPLR